MDTAVIVWVEWYQRLPTTLQVIWPFWLIAGVVLVAVSAAVPAQKSPVGVIERPAAGATVSSPVQLAGSISDLPKGHSLWLAVRKGDRFWPKPPALTPAYGKWIGTVTEESTFTGSTLSIVLVAASPAATTSLHQWFKGGRSGTHFPGLSASEIKGLEILTEVPVLLK